MQQPPSEYPNQKYPMQQPPSEYPNQMMSYPMQQPPSQYPNQMMSYPMQQPPSEYPNQMMNYPMQQPPSEYPNQMMNYPMQQPPPQYNIQEAHYQSQTPPPNCCCCISVTGLTIYFSFVAVASVYYVITGNLRNVPSTISVIINILGVVLSLFLIYSVRRGISNNLKIGAAIFALLNVVGAIVAIAFAKEVIDSSINADSSLPLNQREILESYVATIYYSLIVISLVLKFIPIYFLFRLWQYLDRNKVQQGTTI